MASGVMIQETSIEIGLNVSQEPAIAVRDLHVQYEIGQNHTRKILDGLSLSIQPGEFVVLLGQTGCGKSTLLRILLGQEKPKSGEVWVSGKPVTRVDSRSGYVPQRYSLFPNRTVLENLMIGPEMSRFHLLGRLSPAFRRFRKDLRLEALRQLKHMGLHATDVNKYPHQLSGGMQQRVSIAQTLMMKSKVLLMDEAFSALDPATRGSLQKLVRGLWEETRPTVVFVTHNTAEALYLGSRVVVLSRDSTDDASGAKVALDLQLSGGGMTLAKDGGEFLRLAALIEEASLPKTAQSGAFAS